MKKMLSVLIAVIMVFALVACGSKEPTLEGNIIDDEDIIKRLDMLNDIGYKIINRQYQLLFNDPNVVIPNYDNQTLYDYQLQLLEEQNPSKLPF